MREGDGKLGGVIKTIQAFFRPIRTRRMQNSDYLTVTDLQSFKIDTKVQIKYKERKENVYKIRTFHVTAKIDQKSTIMEILYFI